MDRDGEVKLADFGVAIRPDTSGEGDDAMREVVGTPYWMAPEAKFPLPTPPALPTPQEQR